MIGETISYRRAIRGRISLRRPESDTRAELYMHVFGKTDAIPATVVVTSEEGTIFERKGIYLDPSRMTVKQINDLCALISMKSEHTTTHICQLLFKGELLIDDNGVTIAFRDPNVIVAYTWPSRIKKFQPYWNWQFFEDS